MSFPREYDIVGLCHASPDNTHTHTDAWRTAYFDNSLQTCVVVRGKEHDIKFGSEMTYDDWKEHMFKLLESVCLEPRAQKLRGVPFMDEFRDWYFDPNSSSQRKHKKRNGSAGQIPGDRAVKRRRL